MRLIDADALKKELEVWVVVTNQPQFYNREEALYIIDSATTADAVPVVRGEWIHGCTDGAGTEFCYCSACGEDALKDKGGYTEFSRYCPNCGAIMEDKP